MASPVDDEGFNEGPNSNLELVNTIPSESEEIDLSDDGDEYDNEENDAQIFNEELNTDVQPGSTVANVPEEIIQFDDDKEEEESTDASDNETNYNITPPVTVQPIKNIGRGRGIRKHVNEPLLSPAEFGRGRYGTQALDNSNQPLPPPRIYFVEQPGYYPKPGRKAVLPFSYYQKRDHPEIQNFHRAIRRTTPLIDFTTKFNQIFIIVDKDDSNERGLQHALRLIQQIHPDLKIDSTKLPHDSWSFGLHIYSIVLEEKIECSLLKLIPEVINNEENRPFWFMFKRAPVFQNLKLPDKNSKKSHDPKKNFKQSDDLKKNSQSPNDPDKNSKKPDNSEKYSKQTDDPKKNSKNADDPEKIFVTIYRMTYADLSYGALTSMSHYFAHQEHIYRKRIRWTLHFRDEFFEIQTVTAQGLKADGQRNLIQKRYRIPTDIIDRAVIIHLWNDGFSLSINMKGNVHELYRERKLLSLNEKDSEPFIRQGIRNGQAMPLFSTIRLRIRVKDDQKLADLLEQEGTIPKDVSANEKDDLIREKREESLDQIREIFKHFLDFFSNNRIHICFGAISQRRASLEQLTTLAFRTFPTFIQSYSWAILLSISFRTQIQIYRSKTFLIQLQSYTEKIYDDEDPAQIDDRFYRLCTYLYRRSLEYIFLNLENEIETGIENYKDKYVQFKKRNKKMPTFDQITSSTAYIPSVVLTPTTINIRPLKLCKLNRVLREKNFGSVLNFALIELRDEAQRLLFPSVFRSLKQQIFNYLKDGFQLTPEREYKYLHHSQSQVKCKQFWFYYHDKINGYLSHEDAYVWMGNFDKERVVAKHAARIALCFTSTDPTIQIPAYMVKYIRDIKDKTGKYTFTDGVGTISPSLRDEIMRFLNRQYEFSVLQIRYGGCKGTLSVDPRLEGREYQLIIRDSMNKFTTDHDILEICKLSAPRTLYLNRQDIVLLESRGVPDTNFLNLQNADHLSLVHALLKPTSAYDLLQTKLLPIFKLRNIARHINIVEEQFFIKLITTCAFNIIREVIDRTRIRVSDGKARNMFGIVDEYGVLEEGQIFIQYTVKSDEKLKLYYNENKREDEIDDEEEKDNKIEQVCQYEGKIVLTKNPCHHPGDLRTFDAVYHPKLAHLKDVVVFPQKGSRPHSNQISGSDLDGDEYVVIWHEALIPETENEDAYDYDSQEDPPKMDRPITRDDINQIVMEVSEQDCLGTLSNIHLAYVDKFGIKSEECKRLAGDISQEVDAAKTGKHPLTNEQIIELRDKLEGRWPDFMKSRGKKEFYPSERILGKLYRSARRSVIGWNRAISNHGNPRHINLALGLAADTNTNVKNQENDEAIPKTDSLSSDKYPLDPYIYHPDYQRYLPQIKYLYRTYQNDLLEIISLYRFQDEIDLLCRCESMDASAGGNKKGSLEDSAAIEVQNLVERTIRDFYSEFDNRPETNICCRFVERFGRFGSYLKKFDCDTCREGKLAKAACAYIHSYSRSNRLPPKSNRRILSFPWLFSRSLIRLRYRNQKGKNVIDRRNTIVGRACSLYLINFEPKFKVFIPENSIDIPKVEFYYKVNEKRTSLLPIGKKCDEKIESVSLLRACFVEILHDWLSKQDIFGNECIETDVKPLIPERIWHELLVYFLSGKYQPNVRLIFVSKEQNYLTKRYGEAIEAYRLTWENREFEGLQDMFKDIHDIAVRIAKNTKETIWTYLDEYIISALQCIGVEKQLVDQWICPK